MVIIEHHPQVSTLSLLDIIADDEISQAFPCQNCMPNTGGIRRNGVLVNIYSSPSGIIMKVHHMKWFTALQGISWTIHYLVYIVHDGI